MDEYRTASDEIVHIGDRFRDSRKSNVRTLRVDRLENEYFQVMAYCTVIRQEHDGTITKPMRATEMRAERLVSRAFVRVEGQ